MEGGSVLNLNGSYAMVNDFYQSGSIWMYNGSNLTIYDDLAMGGGWIESKDSVVYLTGSLGCVLNIDGYFHDLVVDLTSAVDLYSELLIHGDLMILDGDFQLDEHDLELHGDYYCDESASLRTSA